MNQKLSAITLVAGMFIVSSCQNTDKKSAPENVVTDIPAESIQDEIVTASVTNAQGNILNMAFNNTAGTASMVLGTDTILLQQDTMASGVRFSNERYIYTEHQGEITLTKRGEVVFEHRD